MGGRSVQLLSRPRAVKLEQLEIERLRREVAKLRAEHDILLMGGKLKYADRPVWDAQQPWARPCAGSETGDCILPNRRREPWASPSLDSIKLPALLRPGDDFTAKTVHIVLKKLKHIAPEISHAHVSARTIYVVFGKLARTRN